MDERGYDQGNCADDPMSQDSRYGRHGFGISGTGQLVTHGASTTNQYVDHILTSRSGSLSVSLFETRVQFDGAPDSQGCGERAMLQLS